MGRLGAVLLAMTLVGCATARVRGSVVMKISEGDAHVCMGRGEVTKGVRVRLYHNECSGGLPLLGTRDPGSPAVCKRKPGGQGTVTEVLNDHYSVVRFEPGTAFKEGDTVETF